MKNSSSKWVPLQVSHGIGDLASCMWRRQWFAELVSVIFNLAAAIKRKTRS